MGAKVKFGLLLKVVLSPKIQIQFFTLQESPDDADSKTENRIVLSRLVLEISPFEEFE